MAFVECEASISEDFLFPFTSLALRTVIDPDIKSSTYNSFRSFATTSGSLSSQLLRRVSMTPPRRNGDEVSPKKAPVNRKVSKGECLFGRQWKGTVSQSASLILTSRNAFYRSPVMATGLKRPLARTLQVCL